LTRDGLTVCDLGHDSRFIGGKKLDPADDSLAHVGERHRRPIFLIGLTVHALAAALDALFSSRWGLFVQCIYIE